MLPVEELLREQEKFLDLLERSAEHARDSVVALERFRREAPAEDALEALAESRRREKETHGFLKAELSHGVIASLDRDDVEALARALYRIPKTVEKIAERLLLAPHLASNIELGRPLAMLESAGQALMLMVRALRQGVDLRGIQRHHEQLQAIEGETDKLVVDVLRALYGGEQDAIRILFVKELFELIENVTDRFRDAGNVIRRMVLKTS